MKEKGFTLIELLVVLAIIGLLASLILTSAATARSRSRDTKRKTDIAQIQKALELYYGNNNQYPASGGAITPNNGWSNSSDSSWDTFQTALAQYIKLPKDPSENNNPNEYARTGYHYSYYSLSYGCSQQWYMLVYQLETASGSDPGITACDGTLFQYGGTGANTNIKTMGARGK